MTVPRLLPLASSKKKNSRAALVAWTLHGDRFRHHF
jgi:hypothetical protein